MIPCNSYIISGKFIKIINQNKKFATLERRVGETLHVANDMTLATTLSNVLAKHFGHIRCLIHCVGEAFQNVIFYISEVIDIIYIYKLSIKNFIS